MTAHDLLHNYTIALLAFLAFAFAVVVVIVVPYIIWMMFFGGSNDERS